MLYTIKTSGGQYKEGPHTRRLQKLGFIFQPITKNTQMRSKLGYDCELIKREIVKDMTADEVIKLSHKFALIILCDSIQIYDGYIE